jgi:hypothetical protein
VEPAVNRLLKTEGVEVALVLAKNPFLPWESPLAKAEYLCDGRSSVESVKSK